MKKYAVLNSDSEVVNIIIAASLDIAESVTSSYCVLIPLGTHVDLGFLYSGGEFSAPPLTEEQEAAAAAWAAICAAPDAPA